MTITLGASRTPTSLLPGGGPPSLGADLRSGYDEDVGFKASDAVVSGARF